MTEITSPTHSKAWEKLIKLSRSFKKEDFRLVNLFNDPSRFSHFSLKHDNLTLDYSKNLLDKETLQVLFELAEDMRLGESVTAMFQGEKINTSEDRSASHTALRIPAKENPNNEITECLKKMEKAVSSIHSGAWKGLRVKRLKTS